ncbi:MAG: ribose-phosphate pyrophosphokinase [Parcubacteria group bacterium]|jgi:ribose-phosphate pyrophosphokinase
MQKDDLKIFTGNSNPDLADKICEILKHPCGKAVVSKFNDGEVRVEIGENVRGADVYVIQTGANPVNDSLMELLVMIDALKRASAGRITAVIPYYAYSRQERKGKPRAPISAKLVADLLVAAGVSRILTMDLHASQIQGFFNIPVDNLFASPILLPYLKKNFAEDVVIVSPDTGGATRAKAYASRLGTDLALIYKSRAEVGKIELMNVVGDVKGKTAIILDDMIDTGGTLIRTCDLILGKGASKVFSCVTHGIFSGDAHEKIQKSNLSGVICTDTLPVDKNGNSKLEVLSTAEIFAHAIKNIHNNESISELFEITY